MVLTPYNDDTALVEYWLSRRDGSWYYACGFWKAPCEDVGYYIERVEFRNGILYAYPKRSASKIGLLFLASAVLLAMGVFFFTD